MLLSEKNRHVRDEKIEFIEEGHLYKINGASDGYISVTTFVGHWFEEFDADAVIDKMMRSKKWPQNKMFGKTKEEIKAEWKQKGEDASRLGTLLHLSIENYYNELESPEKLVEAEFQKFLEFAKDMREDHGLRPYRTEWVVFDEDSFLAGSIDMVFTDSQNRYYIYDWKRTEQLKEENYFQSGKYPLHEMADTNYWHYCIQLNLYKYILEKNYNMKIEAMYLVCIHPNLPTYIRREVNDHQDLIRLLIVKRICSIQPMLKLAFPDGGEVDFPHLLIPYSKVLEMFYESHVECKFMKVDAQELSSRSMGFVYEFYQYYHAHLNTFDKKSSWCTQFLGTKSDNELKKMLLICDFFQMDVLQDIIGEFVAVSCHQYSSP